MKNGSAVPFGILGFPITPFDVHGKLDEHALVANIQFLIKEGISSIFIACGSGEFQSLSRDEYRQMLEVAIRAAGRKVPVYSGVGGNLASALEFAQISEREGVDGYLLLPPYLIEGEQEGLYQYIKSIVESTDRNAILYQRDNAIFTVETLQRLIENPHVVGFKDGYGNMEHIIELTQTIGERLEWYNGMPFAEVTMPAYASIGFRSYSSAISNYIPHISKLFYEAMIQQNTELVSAIYQDVLLPINNIRKLRKGYAVSLIKAGMEIVGLPVGLTVRAPLIPVEKEHYLQLESILRNAFEKYPKTELGLQEGAGGVKTK